MNVCSHQRYGPTLIWLGWSLLSILTVQGHQVEGANLQLVAELLEGELTYEVTAETSLVPPLAEVTYGSALPDLATVKEPLERYFREHCSVLVDGIVVSPILDSIDFVEEKNRVNLGAVADFVMAYFVFKYPLKAPPQTIDMRWSIFLPDRVKDIVPQEPDPTGHDPQTVDAVFYTNGELDLITFKPSEPQFIWHTPKPILSVEAAKRLQEAAKPLPLRERSLVAPLLGGLLLLTAVLFLAQGRRLPIWQAATVGLLVVGVLLGHQALVLRSKPAPMTLAPQEALQRFQDLHRNIYRAFDYDRDEEIYDTLAQSVSGDLLDDVYAEVYKSLVVKEEGGAVSRVRGVEYATCELAEEAATDGEGYAIDCAWQVSGLVKHWGHTHERLNGYEARYEMRPEAGVWRITAVKVVKEEHLDPGAEAAEG